MTTKEITNFQVIGSQTKMQKISFNENLQLIDCIFYEIDFYADFSTFYIDSQPIIDMPIASIFEFIKRTETCDTNHVDDYIYNDYFSPPTLNRHHLTLSDLKAIDKQVAKEYHEEQEWKARQSRVNPKKSLRKLTRRVKRLTKY